MRYLDRFCGFDLVRAYFTALNLEEFRNWALLRSRGKYFLDGDCFLDGLVSEYEQAVWAFFMMSRAPNRLL